MRVATTTTGRVLVEERDRAVLHLACRVRLGRDVRDLLELERALERDRQADMTAEIEEERRAVVPLRDLLDRVVAVEEVLDLLRQRVERVEDERQLFGRQRLAHLGELERDEEEQRDLRGERLRRSHRHLDAAPRVEHRVDLTRDLRAHHVRDRDRVRTHGARELHRLDRVAGLARLRDADHERGLVEHRVAVDPLGGDVVLDRDARPLLDRVARGDTGVIRGAGGEDDDAAQPTELVVVHPETLELEAAVADAVTDRVGDGLRLLVDLLEHEGLVAHLLRALVVPVELDDLSLDGLTACAALKNEAPDGSTSTMSPSSGNCTLPGVAQERGGIRGEERLVLGEADHHRAAEPGADELPGMLLVDDGEGEVPSSWP